MNGACDFCGDAAVAHRPARGGGDFWEMCAIHVNADERIGNGVVWQKPLTRTLPTDGSPDLSLARTVKGTEP